MFTVGLTMMVRLWAVRVYMDEYAAVRRLIFCVRVGMYLLNNITNFVANVIKRVRQAVWAYFLMCRLAYEVGVLE